MSVDSTKINLVKNVQTNQTSVTKQENSSSAKFSDELKQIDNTDKIEEKKTQEVEEKHETEKTEEAKATEENRNIKTQNVEDKDSEEEENSVEDALNDLGSVVDECNKVSQMDDKIQGNVKKYAQLDDNKEEGKDVLNNDININENKDIMPQMTPNMNFSGDGQPFSSFMKDENQSSNVRLSNSEKDLAEEAAILSSMAENIAIARKNEITQAQLAEKNSDIDLLTEAAIKNIADAEIQESKSKIVEDNSGIKKVDKTNGVTLETIVKYDNIIMNEADVEVFADLVQNGSVDMNNLAPEAAQKSVNVSKTLADMLAKSMQDNKPLRIDFDNDISIIIRVSRDGKLSADFLPSSQIAEAYLKENLPLLKQRFDENNIQYDELNQRDSREKEREQHKRKDQDNE